MIIPKYATEAQLARFGCSGDFADIPPDALVSTLTSVPASLPRPRSALPLRCEQLARVGMIASPRLYEGFAWHNLCYQLAPRNYNSILELAKPDYLLVESCIYDSARAWPLECFGDEYAQNMRAIAECARKAHVPSVYWYTLGPETLDLFISGLRHFDFIACADAQALSILTRAGIQARHLPWAFSPEQFNPFTNIRLASYPPVLLFDGIARMLRFPHVRECLQEVADCDLKIVDSSMLIAPNSVRQFPDKKLGACIAGNISQKLIQELYKTVTAFLSLSGDRENFSPAQQWRCLEAAACRCPVLHYGTGANTDFISAFAEILPSISHVKEYYNELKIQPLEKERAGHLAWRVAHEHHTFAHRMDMIHGWIGLDVKAVTMPKASIITPSMRPENLEFVLKQYEDQTYPHKELVYAFNGSVMPVLPKRPYIVAVQIPREYSTGMVMNAGIRKASGEYCFKLDDDDLYGSHYVADRMICFRELAIDVLGMPRPLYRFKGEPVAHILYTNNIAQTSVAYALGNVDYLLTNFSGATVAVARKYALAVGYQEQAYANADVSFLFKGMFFASDSGCLNTDCLNFCVQRGNPEEHTWAITRAKLLATGKGQTVPLDKIFI